jgi:hypothetical protein
VLRQFEVAGAVLDLTPYSAPGLTFTKSAIKAPERGGRVNLMGATQKV